MSLVTIAVAHLETREPLFSAFEVEMWDNAESQKLATKVIEGAMLPATRITTSGGTSVLKCLLVLGTSVNTVQYRTRVFVKNIGTKTVRVQQNLGPVFTDIAAGESKAVDMLSTGDGATSIHFHFRSLAVDDVLDFIAHVPSIVRTDTGAELIPHHRRTFSPINTGTAGYWEAYDGSVVTPIQDQEALTSFWKQKDVTFFSGLTAGTVYKFKSRVHIRGGGNPSPFTTFQLETAGDTNAPNPTYSPSVTVTEAGVRIDANPQSPPTDTDRYEFYWNKTNTAPNNSTTLPNAPVAKAPNAVLILVLGVEDYAYVWVRAVDTSGNQQVWTFLSVFGMRQYVGQGLIGFNNTDHIKSVPMQQSPTASPPTSGTNYADVQNEMTRQGLEDYILNQNYIL